jgi:hypothetical protein
MENLSITYQTKKAIAVVIIGILVVILAILTIIAFELTTIQSLIMSWILTTAYAIFGILIVDPRIIINPTQTIEREVPVEVEREVIRTIQIPMENKTIEVVDRPIYIEVPVEVEKTIYRTRTIERRHKHLNIPKYEFLGSTQTKTYHKRTCKFSKMLKKKFKLHSNNKNFFKKKHYKACKTCINKKKNKVRN